MQLSKSEIQTLIAVINNTATKVQDAPKLIAISNKLRTMLQDDKKEEKKDG